MVAHKTEKVWKKYFPNLVLNLVTSFESCHESCHESCPVWHLMTARAPAKRRFWTRPGRTSAWWDNFASQNIVPEEWKENFRRSRDTFLILCEERRPFIQKQATNMRLPVDVERQVASSLYYLSDEGCIRKTANAFGLSCQVISVIIRRVCIAITVHLGPKYIKLPSWHPLKLKLKRQLPSFFIAIVSTVFRSN